MNRRVWIEGFLLVAISCVSLAESLHLIFYKDPSRIYDWLGPGGYLLLVSISLLVTGVIHISHHIRKEQSIKREEASQEMRVRLFGSVVVIAIYFVLIDVTGYSIATFAFFILIFRIFGIRSWLFNVALSIFLTTAYYSVFVKYCNMVFPKGLLF